MSQLLKQALFLFTSFGVVFLWKESTFVEFTIPLLGFLVFLYLLLASKKPLLWKKSQSVENTQQHSLEQNKKKIFNKDEINIFILNTIVFLLIFSTGSLKSPLFFLLYFISFGIAFVLLPQIVFVFILGSILIFIPDALSNQTPSDTKLLSENLVKLASLGLISPLAYFFGKEYQERLIHQEKDKEVAEIISNEAANVLNNEEEKLSEEDKEQLVDIIEESEKLKE
ncbi:MAG: hypothetical protein KatS3mg089_0912 [Patescibacteria group bacterium]|nr:MAG: hypothetical protein KatS3mg089_0912 [Patescibacteria group bacterium]